MNQIKAEKSYVWITKIVPKYPLYKVHIVNCKIKCLMKQKQMQKKIGTIWSRALGNEMFLKINSENLVEQKQKIERNYVKIMQPGSCSKNYQLSL